MPLPWYSWLIGFGLTLLFELPVLHWALRPLEPKPSRRLAVGILANLATHPLVWFFFPHLPISYGATVAASELWALVAESAIYAVVTSRPHFGRACLASALANGTSFALGWIVVTRFARWLF